MKNCNICGLDKPEADFSTGRNQCKICIREKKRNYYHLNLDDRKKYSENYRKNNSDKIKETDSKYYQNNKEKVKDRVKEYNTNNTDKIKECKQKYYQDNKEQIKDYIKNNEIELKIKRKIYTENNKVKINEYQRNYLKKRRKSDILFKLSGNIRSLIRQLFVNNGYKKGKTIDIIGCTFEELKKYLESKFEYWMTWENYGLYNGELNYGWDIDHIIPVSISQTEDDIIRLNHYSNLQPLCSKTNRDIKRDKLFN